LCHLEEVLEEGLPVPGVVFTLASVGMVGEGVIPILSAVTSPGCPADGGLCPMQVQATGHILIGATGRILMQDTGRIPSPMFRPMEAVFTHPFRLR